jgi:tRNA(Ser,Leu) C12 N-acetylase TAN1
MTKPANRAVQVKNAIPAGRSISSWNVVVTLSEGTYFEARRLLRRWGNVRSTGFYHVLVMQVADVTKFMTEFAAEVAESPGILNVISHVAPARATIDFDGAADFETRAAEIVRGWAGEIAGKQFHVRLHRRGLKHVLSTPREEKFLDTALLEALHESGAAGSIDFEDSDAVIQIETVNGRAGLSLWSRDEMQCYGFLG